MESPRKQRMQSQQKASQQKADQQKGNQQKAAVSRILLVEDHEAVAALRCAVLRNEGYRVVLTANGLDACRLIESGGFDLVVTDVLLPAGSGWDVARTAKQNRVPVILSTGWPLPSRASDVDYVLNKPSSITQLVALVHQALLKGEAPAADEKP
jgi:CheY-like chemotaxis protein